MTRQNVEIVRQIYARWGRGEFRAGTVIAGEEFLEAGDS